MKYQFIGLIILIGFWGFSACELEGDKGFYFDEKTFNSNWNDWKNDDIKNYSFTMTGQYPYWNHPRAILMYDYTVNIIVKNGVMDSFEYIGNTPYEELETETILEPEYKTISDMYQKIYDSAQEEKKWWNNYSGNGHIISTTFDIKYNAGLKYITFFEPVSKWKSGTIVDTTAHAVSITNFKVLN
jgi:hypothetical protein